jgi:ribosomal protein S18 acetylase RimI-like enzyme
MKPDDIAFALLDKRDECVIGDCAHIMSENEPWITLKRTCEDIITIIKDEASEVHLALLGEEMVGFAIIKMRGAFVGYIQSIVVKPDYRNRGIGSRFLAYLEDLIFSQYPNVFMCVSSFNPGAKRLYEKLGYETIGEIKDYIVGGHSEILMRKSIAPLSEFKTRAK